MPQEAPHLPRDQPFPPQWTVQRGRDAYLAENGFTVEAYNEPFTRASLFGVPFVVPNPPRHRAAIMRHDIHHVVTGFGTDLTGEAEVSAWELRRGLRGVGLYVGFLVAGLTLLGLLFAPRRTLRAWRVSRPGGSLFHSENYGALMALTIGELRRAMGVPEEGLAVAPRGLHSRAPR